jgi:hypothetical protein
MMQNMGRRGPVPSSGFTFRGHDVVLRARTPAFLAAPGAREHAIADRRGYVSIHRLVRSETLGCWLTRSEAVEIIDGNPWNWHPSNLRDRPLAASLPHGPKFSRPPNRGSGSTAPRGPVPPKAPRSR